MKILMILFSVSVALLFVPVATADCIDDCIDRNFGLEERLAIKRTYGSEYYDEQFDHWFDRCWDSCAAKQRDDSVNANASKQPAPTANTNAITGMELMISIDQCLDKYWQLGEATAAAKCTEIVTNQLLGNSAPPDTSTNAINEFLMNQILSDVTEQQEQPIQKQRGTYGQGCSDGCFLGWAERAEPPQYLCIKWSERMEDYVICSGTASGTQ